MSETPRCLHCDQTKAEIKQNQTICGIVSGYEYQELTDEWPAHRWVDWKDHELPDSSGLSSETNTGVRR